MSIIQKILELLFGTKTEQPCIDCVTKRPYTDINSTKVGEAYIDYPQFTKYISMRYKVSDVPEFKFRYTTKVTGNVTFKIYADGNKDDLNNPEMKTVTLKEADGGWILFPMKMFAARQVGHHTISIDQLCWTSRNPDGSRVYTTYATNTYEFEVVE